MKSAFKKISLESFLLLFGLGILVTSYGLSIFGLFHTPILFGLSLIGFGVALTIGFQHITKIRINFAFIILIIFSLLTFIQGILSVPTTTDAHNYHIPRAIYWLNDHSIFQDIVYTSHDFMGPLPSILLSFWYSLTNTDHFLFLTQWGSYVLTFFLIGKVAKLLSFSDEKKELSQILGITIPIVVLQASSVQTDLFVSIWVLVSTIFSLRFSKTFQSKYGIAVFIAIGIGILSKATMAIFAIIPLGILGWVFMTHAESRKKLIQVALIGGFLILLMNTPHALQNKRLFGSYLGNSFTMDGEEIPFTVEAITIQGIVENGYRNIVMHIPLLSLAPTMDRLVADLGNKIGLSIQQSDSSWFDQDFYHVSFPIPQEDIAPAPIHLLLIGIAGIQLLRRPKMNGQTVLFLLGILAFSVFSTILLWQEFHIRQHTSMLLLSCVGACGILSFSSRSRRLLLVTLISIGFFVGVANTSRPLIPYSFIVSRISDLIPPGFIPPASILLGRNESNYFLSRRYWLVPYTQMVSLLESKGITKVKFTNREGFEYPFIAVAKKKGIQADRSLNGEEQATVYTRIEKEPLEILEENCILTEDRRKAICLDLNP